MPMILHWSPRSPYARKVMISAHELGLVDRIEFRNTLVAIGRPNRDLMADNPLSKIPTLVLEDGTVLVDSGVIVEYLNALVGGGLVPAAGAGRWTILSRQALANGLIDVLNLWRNERSKPPQQQSAEWLSAFAEKTAATVDRFERSAGALGAGEFGIDHIALGCALAYADFRFSDLNWRERRPALTAWYDAFSERPSARATRPFE
ncbi:glutathione S-transferase family protein [Methylobacterium aquaticum]|nr:glutathione S-transferase family protein [Methylobacterium aquaticum]